MHILIVDDEILIRDVIKDYLEIEGYTSDEASKGEESSWKSKCDRRAGDLNRRGQDRVAERGIT